MPASKRPFNLGWGDQGMVDWYLENAGSVPPVVDIEPQVGPAREEGELLIRDLAFDSPFEMLPDAARVVRARWITTEPEPQRVVILHPAWNEEDYAARTKLARNLLGHGIASILIQHPLYGERRRDTALETPVPLVSDFCVMGRAAVLEGRALVAHLAKQGYRVGASGFSMGGNLAGFVAALSDHPVAVAPLAASYAAGPVFLDGVLRHTIAWDALGGRTTAVEERLTRVLTAGSILNHPPPPHLAAAVVVAGTRDGYVPSAASQAIHDHWVGSKMVWVNAGHASLVLRHRHRLAAAIAESFDRLEGVASSE